MKKRDNAYFAAGCFWGVEAVFAQTKGVLETKVGYMGGYTEYPTYEQVCTGQTNHAETVHVLFDTSLTSYDQLLKVFWQSHDPTTLNRQGPDHGTQYRSAIFFINETQESIAQASKQHWQSKFEKPIVTEITRATVFYPAEDYHQKYFETHPIHCHILP